MKTIEELRSLLIATFPKQRIYLFGSRAKGSASEFSDYDIAIESEIPIRKELSYIKTLIEESTIPYKIDLIDLSQAPYLAEKVRKEGIVWH